MHELAERVLAHIEREELLRPGDRVGVAVSGGIDSVALVRLLLALRQELGIVLSVVHFNHKLRGAESDADQEFVAELAREHELEFYVGSGDAAQLAAEEHSGLEAAARELRYGFFGELMGHQDRGDSNTSGAKAQDIGPADRSAESAAPPKTLPRGPKPEYLGDSNGTAEAVPFPISPLNKIATGHTLDDQAETVLMRLLRGTGLRGLGAIHPRIVFEQEAESEDGQHHGEIVRPLLGFRRRDLEKYLIEINQPWREDYSNADSKFTRNRVRKLVLPLLEREFNPAIVEGLAELAEIARDEEDYWENEASGWLGTVVQWSEPAWAHGLPGISEETALVQIGGSHPKPLDEALLARIEQSTSAIMNASVSRPWLLTEPKAVQRRVLKAVGEQAGIPLEFKHVEEILRFAAEDGPAGKELSLPLGWRVVREPEAMVFLTPDLRRQEPIPDYEYPLTIPGRVFVPELGGVIEAMRIGQKEAVAGYNSQQLLRADLLPETVTVRNWRAGDRFWPGQTKAPKKVKELLQQRRVAQPERRLWPVLVSRDGIVWMRGFPVPAEFRVRAGQEAIAIREVQGF